MYTEDERWPADWRERPIAAYDPDLPRDIYQLDKDGDPWNVMWCAENIAIAWIPRAEWEISPMWQPPEPPPPPPDPV